MVLQDLGRRINAAVSDLTRSANLDEKVPKPCFPKCRALLTWNAGFRWHDQRDMRGVARS